jgi:hypothetical protein
MKPVLIPIHVAALLAGAVLAACGGGDEPPTPLAVAQAVATPQPAPAPAAESQPLAASQPLADQAASFTVRVEGGSGAFEYQWLRDGEPIDGANASQYGFVTTLDDGGATFAVRVRPRGAGPGHERESAPATLSWREPAN